MIIMLTYSKRMLPCENCAPNRCEVCYKCLNCERDHNRIICSSCFENGWYICGNHGTICNDKKNKHCSPCYR